MKKEGTGLAIGIPVGFAMGLALDNLAVGGAIGVAIGVSLEVYFRKEGQQSDAQANNPANAAKAAEKDAHIAQVLAEVERKGTITNNDVEALLGVSEATAERYLQELENQGKIVQQGTVGTSVTYTLKQ